jgi:carbonic anhydrase
MSDKDKQSLAASAQSPEAQSADAALRQIVDGFLRFHHDVFPQQEELFKKLATAQAPKAMFITCADSRIVPELITQSSPGDLFVTRNVGNVVPPYGQMNGGVSTAIEYAVLALGVQHIIICGHSDCGAMRAVLNPDSLEKMPTVKAWLRHGHLFIHGWVYNIETSEIKAYDADQGRFLPLDGSHPIPVATPKARF